jgi:hypothetical protein
MLWHPAVTEKAMADDPNNRGQQDRSRISISQEYEVEYWTQALGVSKEELERAVLVFGNSADKVREHLKKSK